MMCIIRLGRLASLTNHFSYMHNGHVYLVCEGVSSPNWDVKYCAIEGHRVFVGKKAGSFSFSTSRHTKGKVLILVFNHC